MPVDRPLRILAGREARARIARDGLGEDLFDVVAGASGGAKWLTLSRLDQAIFGTWFQKRDRPLALIGSSIGCWRFACLAQNDPVAATRRFEANYLGYAVEGKVTPAILTAHCRDMLKVILDDGGADQVLNHPFKRLSILAVRGKGPAGHPNRMAMGAGLAAAALANMASRKTLPVFFERTLIRDARGPAPFDPGKGFPTREVALTAANMEPALLATAAVPFVFEPITDMPGARPGLYLDGGIMDYHLDIPFRGDGLVLYPHFSQKVVPGWFDKFAAWRKADPANLSRMVLICPSAAFVASLPHGKIPDRGDFTRLPTAQRQAYWKRVVAETQRLADIWLDAQATGRLESLVEPLEGS